MFKFLVLATIIYTVNAGLILDHKPAVIVSHGATSHQNSNSLAIHPVPVVAHKAVAVHAVHAPIIAHPVAVHHAPIAIAHAPAISHAAVVHHPVAIGIHH
ncbi:unnamed protein product [Psylliodes chrysocephalus]|uniref:Uncharacterized protein n=1 Tax=Psylliodes chrysocephalus TaxID=3402493 RepID=A0A9P0GDX3_9CUCU|nr:unnamed protein product [Psylliodes chrysocephala]